MKRSIFAGLFAALLLALSLIAAGVTPVLAADPAASTENAGIAKKALPRKGLQCQEKYQLGKQSFDEECRPAFNNLTLQSDCTSFCQNNADFNDAAKCEEICKDCQDFLLLMEQNKNCR